jgi:hypothetical protein
MGDVYFSQNALPLEYVYKIYFRTASRVILLVFCHEHVQRVLLMIGGEYVEACSVDWALC